MIKTKKWNALDYLDSDERIAGFLDAAIEDNDYDHFLHALNLAARAHGVNKMAKEIEVPRESLYKSLDGKHKPNFETIFKVLGQLGLGIRIVPIAAENSTGTIAPQKPPVQLQA
jgi:probable addiction module antidote protein